MGSDLSITCDICKVYCRLGDLEATMPTDEAAWKEALDTGSFVLTHSTCSAGKPAMRIVLTKDIPIRFYTQDAADFGNDAYVPRKNVTGHDRLSMDGN